MPAKHVGRSPKAEKERTYLSQSDVPSCSLGKALRVPEAIGDNYGFKPTTPLGVAKAMNILPGSSGFRMLAGAAIAYGLTDGGYNAEAISITTLGMRIVKPTAEGDDSLAMREAFLRPRVIREFLSKYNGAPLPKENIAHNVLSEMGVPHDRAPEVLKLIIEGAESVGLLQHIKDRIYVSLSESGRTDDNMREGSLEISETSASSVIQGGEPHSAQLHAATVQPRGIDRRAKRVFITHGKNHTLIEPIKKLLSFGEMEAVVSVQTQTVSQSVPNKVMEEMRSCGAAIIHVEDERHLIDKDSNEHIVLNDNVLIEIGAAMALFGQRFILIVKEGVKLPSNLQGLLMLIYKGDTLDMGETVKLMEAVNDMKQRSMP
jgi:predicted nucleotide-binding protein